MLPPPRLLLAISLSGSMRNAPRTGPHSVALPPMSSESTICTLSRIENIPRGSMKVR